MIDNIKYEYDNSKRSLPNPKSAPISPSEKIVREELNRLNQSIEELRRLTEQIKKREINKEEK